MIHLAILGSTRGTNMLALIDAINNKKLAAKIEIVMSNKANAMILERARAHGLNHVFLDPDGLQRADYDKKICEELEKYSVDLVVLIGYMRILTPDFVRLWSDRVINVHPSLLPAFAGKMDTEVHQAVLDSGEQKTGCTIHYVTQEVDAGPIVLQKQCNVLPGDTAEHLKERVQQLEGMALIEAIQLIANKQTEL